MSLQLLVAVTLLLAAIVGMIAFVIWRTIRTEPRTKATRERRGVTDDGGHGGEIQSFGTASDSHGSPFEGGDGDFGGGGATGDWDSDAGDGGGDD